MLIYTNLCVDRLQSQPAFLCNQGYNKIKKIKSALEIKLDSFKYPCNPSLYCYIFRDFRWNLRILHLNQKTHTSIQITRIVGDTHTDTPHYYYHKQIFWPAPNPQKQPATSLLKHSRTRVPFRFILTRHSSDSV